MAKKTEYAVFQAFNPLDKHNLGTSAANALLNSPISPLPPEPFLGAGVYAIYYIGNFPAYKALTDLNKDEQYAHPIYVGKAVPDGARKGGAGDTSEQSKALYKRLNEHAKSIDASANLNLSDFRCRFLAVDDIWIPLTESMLIELFKPVWNCVLDGFGNHDPGKGRHKGKIPFWDCLHPGREWAVRLEPCSLTATELEQKVVEYLNTSL